MIDSGHLAAFFAVAIVLIAVPGPSVVFVVSRGVALGWRGGVATAIGNESGLLIQVLIVAMGLGVVLERWAAVLDAVKLIGAAYLVFLGIQQFRHRKNLAVAAAATEPKKPATIVREGLVVGVTNPKGVVIFTAVLPQFIDRQDGNVSLQLLILGLICIVIALVSDCTWGLLAGSAHVWLQRSPRKLETIGAASGVALVGLGGYLALSAFDNSLAG
jgi:threonine/homoserine/homoserine lactone efflux protein